MQEEAIRNYINEGFTQDTFTVRPVLGSVALERSEEEFRPNLQTSNSQS